MQIGSSFLNLVGLQSHLERKSTSLYGANTNYKHTYIELDIRIFQVPIFLWITCIIGMSVMSDIGMSVRLTFRIHA